MIKLNSYQAHTGCDTHTYIYESIGVKDFLRRIEN